MITKVTFSENIAVWHDELLEFLQTYASDMFDSITVNSLNDIVCLKNIADGHISRIVFDFHNQSTWTNIAYYTDGVEGLGTTLQWDSYAGAPLKAGFATGHGIALQIGRSGEFQGFMWLFLNKASDGNVYMFMPHYENSAITPRWVNMDDPSYYGYGQTMLNGSVGPWTYSASGASLAPLVTDWESFEQNYFTHMKGIWRVVATSVPWYGASRPDKSVGKMTMNGIEFFTNGYIAMEI